MRALRDVNDDLHRRIDEDPRVRAVREHPATQAFKSVAIGSGFAVERGADADQVAAAALRPYGASRVENGKKDAADALAPYGAVSSDVKLDVKHDAPLTTAAKVLSLGVAIHAGSRAVGAATTALSPTTREVPTASGKPPLHPPPTRGHHLRRRISEQDLRRDLRLAERRLRLRQEELWAFRHHREAPSLRTRTSSFARSEGMLLRWRRFAQARLA